MTSKSSGNALPALPTHKVEYAVQKRRPIMLPRRSSASLNATPSAKAKRDIKRIVSKHLNDNFDAKFHDSTGVRSIKDTEKENKTHRLKSCSRKIALKELSQGDVGHQSKRNLRKTKFIFNDGSLQVRTSKNLHSLSGIKPDTNSKDQSKINTSKRDFEDTNRIIKQSASKNHQNNILKMKIRNTLLPTNELRNNNCRIPNQNSQCDDQETKPRHATVETSLTKLKSFSQYQVKQKYKRSSIHLKPFSLFFKKTSPDNVSSLQFDVSSTVKCTKQETLLHEKHLPNSKDLSCLYQNNVVDLSHGENRSPVLLKKSSGKKHAVLRKCETAACIVKGFNPSISSPQNVCQLKATSKKYGKTPASFTTCHIKQTDSNKSLREKFNCKKTHRLNDKQICRNKSIETLELSSILKRKLLICNSQYNKCKQKHRNDKNISLRTYQMNSQECSNINDKTDSQKSFEYAFVKDYNENKAFCIRQTKNTAINITSSFNLRIDVSNGHKSKKPEYKNKPIMRPNIVAFNKNEPTALNKMPASSSISLIKTVYSKLFPITVTRNKEKKSLKEVLVSRKISVNKLNQNKGSPTDQIDKQVPDEKSKILKVQVVENNSILKRCFSYIYNKLTKDRLADSDNLKNSNGIESRNINKKTGNKNLTKCNVLKSKDLIQIKKSDAFRNIKSTKCNRNTIKERNILNSSKTAFDNIGRCPFPVYPGHPTEKLSLSNKYEIQNYHTFLNCSDIRCNVEFHGNFQNPDELNTKLKRNNKPGWISNLSLYNGGVQKKSTVNPVVMSLLHKTKYTNNKSVTSNTELEKIKTYDNGYKFKPLDYDDTLMLYEQHNRNFKATSNISLLKLNPIFEENDTSVKNYQHTEPKNSSLIQCQTNYAQQSHEYVNLNKQQTKQTKYCFPGGKLNMENKKHSKSNLLKLHDGKCTEHAHKYYSVSNSSIKMPSNKFSKLNKASLSKSRFLVSNLSSATNTIDSDLKKSSSFVIEKKNNCKVFKSQEKNKITAAYCHVTYDRSGSATCERDITCAPQCDWVTKKGKRVPAKAHVIDNFCPFEDGNFLIQPCVIENQEDNNKRGKKTIDTMTKNKCTFLKKCLDKKKCSCVCSKGDAPASANKSPNTNFMPKLSLAVDCDTMNIKNREEVLKRVIKLRDEEGENFSQGRNKPPCCCTGSEKKSIRCMSCTNIPNRPFMKQILTLKNMENDPPLEIKMDSDSNILNRKELLERIKKMKESENERLKGKGIAGSGNDTIVNKVKNKLTGKPVCVCKDEVCSRDSDEEFKRKAEATKKEKEKPCVCGAPSCERVSIQRLMKEGKLSKKDGKIILAMIKKQEKIQKKEELRKQRKKVLKERKKLREQHMKQSDKKGGKKKKKKLTAKDAKKGKLTEKELKQLPKDQRELVEQSAKKESVAQKETKKIKKAMQKQKIEDAERKAKEEMQERQQAADLEMKFKRQMLADDRREKKDLRKKQFSERIKRAKEGRVKKMLAQKRQRQLELKKQQQKLKEKIEDEELKKQKELQQIALAEKERLYREKEARKKKKERMQQEKLQMKKRDQALKLKLLKEKQKRAAILKKKKEKEKKLKRLKIQKENKRFLKEMGKIAAAERKKQKKEAERKHQLKMQRHEFMRTEIKKYKDADDRYLVIESLKEAGACCVKYTGKFFDYLMYSAKHPKLTYKKVRRAYLQPGEVATEIQKSWSESDVHDIANRIEAKILALDQLHPIGKKLYEKPKKKRPPKRRFKKRKRNRRAPMDFGCSLYMASLRRKPYFFLYWMCPWFYPHLISMLKVLRQIADLGLFILAVFVWSPFILIYECFRTIMCCGLCTA